MDIAHYWAQASFPDYAQIPLSLICNYTNKAENLYHINMLVVYS